MKKLSSVPVQCLCAAVLVVLTMLLPRQAAAVPMWQVEDGPARMWLLGSVHLLRAEDHPLPEAIYEAYEEADVLVMEMDMSEADPREVQALVNELGMNHEDGSLSEVMGAKAYAEAEALAEEAGIPLTLLERSKPWFAALTVEQLMLTRIGFSAEFGIETILTARAQADGKKIIGLESLREQLTLLDDISPDGQRALLLQSLRESIDMEELMDGLVAAWQRGDTAFLEEVMLQGLEDHPELYGSIVAERNRSWLERIAELLESDVEYLVIVGALHLVGEDGLPTLLSERGYDVRKLQRPGPAQ